MKALQRVLLFLSLAVVAAGCQESVEPALDPAGTFAFAAFGDAPYDFAELSLVQEMIEGINADRLVGALHVGDIFGFPCDEASYHHRFELLQTIHHPLVYTPGDNEWTDCWRGKPHQSSVPLERLQLLRSIFFQDPSWSLGRQRMALRSQGDFPPHEEFVENVRWQWDGVLFATLHMVGSSNGLDPFPARTAADFEAVTRRTDAAIHWLRLTFEEAKTQGAPAVVLMFHAEPGFVHAVGHPNRQGFELFLEALEQEAAAFDRPILLIHGDDHEMTVDHPLVDRRDGRVLEHVTRLQVFGSPDVGYVRVVVHPQQQPMFRFEQRLFRHGLSSFRKILSNAF